MEGGGEGGLENSRVHLTNLTSSIRRGQRLFFKSQICAGLIPTDFQPYKLIPKKKNSSTNRNIPLYMRNAGCHWISLSARIAKKKKSLKCQVTVIIWLFSTFGHLPTALVTTATKLAKKIFQSEKQNISLREGKRVSEFSLNSCGNIWLRNSQL